MTWFRLQDRVQRPRHHDRKTTRTCAQDLRAPVGSTQNSREGPANGVPTIMDGKTGLAWQRDLAPDPLSWADARLYCAAFGRAAHLPSAKELLSIVDWQAPAAIDLGTFPNTPSGDSWTATTVAGSSVDALTVSFGNNVYTGLHTAPRTEQHVVRCLLNP